MIYPVLSEANFVMTFCHGKDMWHLLQLQGLGFKVHYITCDCLKMLESLLVQKKWELMKIEDQARLSSSRALSCCLFLGQLQTGKKLERCMYWIWCKFPNSLAIAAASTNEGWKCIQLPLICELPVFVRYSRIHPKIFWFNLCLIGCLSAESNLQGGETHLQGPFFYKNRLICKHKR